MPLYRFVVSRNGVAEDHPSMLDLPNIQEAWAQATKSASELLKDLDGSLKAGTVWSVEIQDDAQRRLRTLLISAKSHEKQ